MRVEAHTEHMTSTCTICDGTGFDAAFGSPCDCARFTGRRYGLVAEHLSGNATR